MQPPSLMCKYEIWASIANPGSRSQLSKVESNNAIEYAGGNVYLFDQVKTVWSDRGVDER